MPIETTGGAGGEPVTLRVVGRFDFSMNAEFRKAYETFPAGTPFVVDFGRTEYLDSSALGMLLLLRRHAGDTPAAVRLTNASPTTTRVLSIARFDQLFRVG